MKLPPLFVTGTDTGVGKTLVSAALLRRLRERGLRVAGMKPVASGCVVTPDGLRNEDALALQAEASRPWPYGSVNPYAYEPAIAPHIAAAAAGRRVDLDTIVRIAGTMAAETDALVVEGAGGWLVPLDEASTLADLAVGLRAQVVLVVGLRLGCLNHAVLTAEAVAARGLRLAGWVGNGVDPAFECLKANVATLDARLPAPRLGLIPPLTSPSVALAGPHLDVGPLLAEARGTN
jgi:dethiobiotin synthetase